MRFRLGSLRRARPGTARSGLGSGAAASAAVADWVACRW